MREGDAEPPCDQMPARSRLGCGHRTMGSAKPLSEKLFLGLIATFCIKTEITPISKR